MIYKFNNIQLDVAKRTLEVNGERQNVQPKVFDLLVFLIESRDRAVSKEDIQEAIWTDLEVSETALTRAVMKARKLIHDQGEVIKTVHGHGYHFVADVEQIISEATGISTQKNVLKSWFAPLMLAVVLALVGVASLQLIGESDASGVSVAVLPVKDQTNDPEMGWVSMGLMSLATQMIKGENTVKVVSHRKTSAIDVEEIPVDLNVSDEQLAALNSTLESNYLILSSLKTEASGSLILEYKLYHPDGSSPIQRLQGDNPTSLVQQMTKNIIATLPGSSTSVPYRVVSDDVFTNELYSRGMAFQLKGDAKKARDYFKLASEEDASLFWPRYELALTTRMLGLHQEAKQELLVLIEERENLTQDPVAEVALLNAMANVESLLGDHKLSLQYYEDAYAVAESQQLIENQALIATNVGLGHRRLGDFEQARSWIARSIVINEKNQLPVGAYNYFQLAQIERNSGDNDKALEFFQKALTIYRQEEQLRFVASISSSMGRIYARQGYWQKAHDFLDESLALKTELSDHLGVIDTHLSRLEVFIAEGRYQNAQEEISMAQSLIADMNNQSRARYLKRYEIELMYQQGQTDHLLDELNAVDKRVFNTKINGIALKLKYLAGNTDAARDWILSHQENESEKTLSQQLMYWDMRAFVAEQEQNGDYISYLDKRIQLARQMGLYAIMTEAYLRMADHYIALEQWSEVGKIIDNLSFYPLNWWQVDLLKAQLAQVEKRHEEARTLAQQAHSKATDAWQPSHQHIYESIVGTVE